MVAVTSAVGQTVEASQVARQTSRRESGRYDPAGGIITFILPGPTRNAANMDVPTAIETSDGPASPPTTYQIPASMATPSSCSGLCRRRISINNRRMASDPPPGDQQFLQRDRGGRR